MALTTAQLPALKAAIDADQVLSAKPRNGDGDFDIAAAFNLAAAPDFFVWRTNASTEDIFNQITWANFTPNDTVPTDTALNNAIWQARAWVLQIKQINLQVLLTGRTTFNASKTTQRNGLSDATQNLPSGNNGNLRTAGWTNILPILSRTATRAEKLFAVTTAGSGADQTNIGTTGPATLVFEGSIAPADVNTARNS